MVLVMEEVMVRMEAEHLLKSEGQQVVIEDVQEDKDIVPLYLND